MKRASFHVTQLVSFLLINNLFNYFKFYQSEKNIVDYYYDYHYGTRQAKLTNYPGSKVRSLNYPSVLMFFI